MAGEERKRTVKLFCPSLSKIVQLVAWEEQRLDLGSIATAFGIDSATLKLNGHFIGRGVDLIASSVTWKSLLTFFSARGLSTGATVSDALIVDGKLSKLGSKRGHDPTDPANGILIGKQLVVTCPDQTPIHGDADKTSNKRFKESNSGNEVNQITRANCLRLKRRSLFGDDSLLKKVRIKSTDLGFQERKDELASTISCSQFSCSFSSESTKRAREEDLVVAALCKRIRLWIT